MAAFGFPVIDDAYVAMPHGPVNSDVYRHVKGTWERDGWGWSDFLESGENERIRTARQCQRDDLDELSQADIQVLDKVWDKFGAMDRSALRRWTRGCRNLPEWEDFGGVPRPIPLERILAVLQIENADEQVSLIEDHKYIDSVFDGLRC